ncbi:hypothetical protein C9J85_01890 [Haloferax sp. wsp5]|nr:hypothetical protein C9J85_01890 [Haloferax sp. wsp5]
MEQSDGQLVHRRGTMADIVVTRYGVPKPVASTCRAPRDCRSGMSPSQRRPKPSGTGLRMRPSDRHDVSPELLDAADSLTVRRAAAGYDHLPLSDLATATSRVTNASGVHGPNIAENVLGSWLAFARRSHARRHQRDHIWQSFHTDDFAGSRVCVVGLGELGEAVVDRVPGSAWRPSASATRRRRAARPTRCRLRRRSTKRSPHGVRRLACPLTDATRGLVDAAAFRTMLPTPCSSTWPAARSSIPTRSSALRSNRIRGAALDVTDPEPLPAATRFGASRTSSSRPTTPATRRATTNGSPTSSPRTSEDRANRRWGGLRNPIDLRHCRLARHPARASYTRYETTVTPNTPPSRCATVPLPRLVLPTVPCSSSTTATTAASPMYRQRAATGSVSLSPASARYRCVPARTAKYVAATSTTEATGPSGTARNRSAQTRTTALTTPI